MDEKKTYWITDSRFKFIAILLILIFLVFMAFLFIEAEVIKKNPCSICAEKMGKNVVCTIQDGKFLSRSFFYNGTILDGYLGD